MGRYVKTAILSFVVLLFFPFHGLGIQYLDDAQADKVYAYQTKKWVPVYFKQPVGFETIFNELPPTLWPVLPLSYEWRVIGDQVFLYKHKLALDHNFDFVTYATDSATRFNFLSRWDGVTYQSFSFARHKSPLSSYDSARQVFPNPQFTFEGQTYTRGHLIDYMDTFNLTENSKVGSGTMIESISSLDPRNYIPEPTTPTDYWGKTVRKNLVEKIRAENGCYAQYMHYAFDPAKTNDESAAAIPKGVYFVRLGEKASIESSYDVSWQDPIHKGSGGKSWDINLQTVCVPDTFFPITFVHDIENVEENVYGNNLPDELEAVEWIDNHRNFHTIARAADHEIHTVSGKLSLILGLIDLKHDPIEIQKWLKRLIKHANKIHENDSRGFMDVSQFGLLLKKIKIAQGVDPSQVFAKWIRYLLEQDKQVPTAEYPHVKFQLQISKPDVLPPVREIDVSLGKLDDRARTVVASLQQEPRIRLLNMTTQRAKRIAELIKSTFPNPRQRQDISLEYSPSPKSTQVKGIRPAFTGVGVTPNRSSPSTTTPEKSPLSESPSPSPIALGKKALSPKIVAQRKKDKVMSYLLGLSDEERIDLIRQLAKKGFHFQTALDSDSMGEDEEESNNDDSEEGSISN